MNSFAGSVDILAMISGSMLPSQIFSLLNVLLDGYYFLIMGRLILSWFVNSYKLENHPLGYWLCVLTDPFLRLFRRLPFTSIGGVVDISPIFALLSLNLLQRFIHTLRVSQSASFGVVFLSILLQLFNMLFSIAQTISVICAVILLFRLLHILFSKPSNYNVALGHIDFYIRKLIQGPFRFLNLHQHRFLVQVITLFIIFSLLVYSLSLASNLLNGFIFSIMTRI